MYINTLGISSFTHEHVHTLCLFAFCSFKNCWSGFRSRWRKASKNLRPKLTFSYSPISPNSSSKGSRSWPTWSMSLSLLDGKSISRALNVFKCVNERRIEIGTGSVPGQSRASAASAVFTRFRVAIASCKVFWDFAGMKPDPVHRYELLAFTITHFWIFCVA